MVVGRTLALYRKTRVLMLRMTAKQVPVVIALSMLMSGLSFAASATDSPWQYGTGVQLANVQIHLDSVRSGWESDYDPITNSQGPIYFNDCVAFTNRSAFGVAHVQIVFAAVNSAGAPERPLMPLDIRYKAKPLYPQQKGAGCRLHAYGNGVGGLRLVAWVSVVDFANGTSWHAPPMAQIIPRIVNAIGGRTSGG